MNSKAGAISLVSFRDNAVCAFKEVEIIERTIKMQKTSFILISLFMEQSITPSKVVVNGLL